MKRLASLRWLWLLAGATVLVAAGLFLALASRPPAPPVGRPTTPAPQRVAAPTTGATAPPVAPPTLAPTATAVAPASLVQARDWPGLARTFDARSALADIERLAGREFAGRQTGAVGGRAAAEYIAGRFQVMGLQPAGDGHGYMQQFAVPFAELAAVPSLTLTNGAGKQFVARYPQDFAPYISAYFGAGVADGALAWAGHGAAGTIDGPSIAGSIVVVQSPPDAEAYGQVIRSGAAGMLILHENAAEVTMGRPARERSQVDQPIPCAHIGPDVMSFILAGSGSTLLELNGRQGVLPLPCRARLEISTREEPQATAQNVLGVLPGRSAALSGEVVIIGAHYDHLGALPDGSFYPGANDNASGVAALLEIARSWQSAGFAPERTVLFAAWAGEEERLWGSQRYVQDPAFPLASTVAMLQLDMVGSSPEPVLLVDGDGLLADHTLAAAAELGVTVHTAEVGGSDHTPFRVSHVPAELLIWPGFYGGDYHQQSDTPETISPDLLRQAGSLAELVALRLGMAEPVPAEIEEQAAPATP